MTYPCIRFVCRYGRKISQWMGLIALLATLVLSYQCNSFGVLALGLFASLTLSAVLRLIAEIVEVVADALLPR
jgi:hypothetical protein